MQLAGYILSPVSMRTAQRLARHLFSYCNGSSFSLCHGCVAVEATSQTQICFAPAQLPLCSRRLAFMIKHTCWQPNGRQLSLCRTPRCCIGTHTSASTATAVNTSHACHMLSYTGTAEYIAGNTRSIVLSCTSVTDSMSLNLQSNCLTQHLAN